MGELWEVALEGVRPIPEFGTFVQKHGNPRYHHANLEREIATVFGRAKLELLEGALEFPSAEPALAYFDSSRTQYRLDEPTWAKGREAFHRVLEKTAYPWRVSKRVAVLTSTR